MFNLEEELKNLPDQPGVYIMHDANDTVIYVGKAKILKNRVRQYFRSTDKHTPKVRVMVSKISYFEYIVTGTEKEALVLECNLIKKYRPRYNVLLKDDKNYPYIKVNMQDDYPSIRITRTLKDDGAKYFGPYIGKGTAKTNIDVIQKIFKPPLCGKKFPEDIGKTRPCLNFHIKNCIAPCTGNISREDYREIFENICDFLAGGHDKLIKDMTKKMMDLSEDMEYEKAAVIRDRINAIKTLDEKQRIIDSDKQSDMDVIDTAIFDNKAFLEIFFVRSGKIMGRESFRLDDAEDKKQALLEYVKQFYSRALFIPREILLGADIEDKELIEEWLTELKGKKVTISVPVRGKKADLVRFAAKNVEQAISNYKIMKLREQEKYNNGEELAKVLGLLKPVKRIEAYDISNISGTDNVAGMVVFENGKPLKSAYRKFKIKSFEGADDYSAMREVIYRRFRNALEEEEMLENGVIDEKDIKFLPLPDVIFVDGGKGHINAVKSMLEEIEFSVPVYGMVKNDKHKTRGLLDEDGEAEINMTSSLFNFITRIQDEVHRYAITYHRNVRTASAIRSVLDNIVGVGEKKRVLLFEKFGSIDSIAAATIDELKDAGIDAKTAENIVEFFNK